METYRLIRWVSLLALLLAACGGGGPSTVAPAEDTVEPPLEVSPALTPTASLPPPTIPASYRSYEDRQAGFSIHYPADWIIASQSPGNLVILQTFAPEEAGTEGIPAGESKCDVIVRQDVATLDQAVAQMQADDNVEILTQFPVARADGGHALVLELASERVGEHGVLLTEIEGKVLTVSCLGNQAAFDAISSSLQPLP